MQSIWKRALEMQNAPVTKLMTAIGKVYALPDQIALQMEHTPGYHPRDVQRWWDPLAENFITLHLKNTWRGVNPEIAQSTLDDIESCSAKLSHFAPEPHLTDDQLLYVAQQVEHIRNEIKKEEALNADAKRIIDLRLHRIEDALASIKITGIGQVQVELEATSVTSAAEAQKPRPEAAKKVFQGIGWALGRTLQVLQIWNLAHGSPQLPPSSPSEPPSHIFQIGQAKDEAVFNKWVLPPPDENVEDEELDTEATSS